LKGDKSFRALQVDSRFPGRVIGIIAGLVDQIFPVSSADAFVEYCFDDVLNLTVNRDGLWYRGRALARRVGLVGLE
jgi:hypothetical protein